MDGQNAADLAAQGHALSRHPLLAAVSRNRRAAILLPTQARYLTALAACAERDAVLINPLSAPSEIAYQLEDSGAALAWTASRWQDKLPNGFPRVLCDGAPRMILRRGDCIRELKIPRKQSKCPEESLPEAVIVYTSAMAGVPLGAIFTRRSLAAHVRAAVEVTGMDSSCHMLAVLPCAHLFGLTAVLAALLAGGRVTTLDYFNERAALRLLESDDINSIVGVPSLYAALVAAMERRGRPLDSTLGLCICGGATLDAAIENRWREWAGIELRQGYGLTEAGPICLFNRIDRPSRPGTVGSACPGIQVEIRDPGDGHRLPRGKTGEICLAGGHLFSGYVSGAEKGLRFSGGWLQTGDLGRMDETGTVTFQGVIKPMFTRNAYNIYPREIERVVRRMQGVRNAAVTFRESSRCENDILLDVVGDVTTEATRSWCRNHLAAYKQPTSIRVRPSSSAGRRRAAHAP